MAQGRDLDVCVSRSDVKAGALINGETSNRVIRGAEIRDFHSGGPAQGGRPRGSHSSPGLLCLCAGLMNDLDNVKPLRAHVFP